MSQTVTSSPWATHRLRGVALRDRHRHAAQVLTLYLALLDTWEEAWRLARADPPPAPELAGWAAEHVLPRVVAVTERFGPHPLAVAVGDLGANGYVKPLLAGWLAGAELEPVERYLARAVLRGPLEAVDAVARAARIRLPGEGGTARPAAAGRN